MDWTYPCDDCGEQIAPPSNIDAFEYWSCHHCGALQTVNTEMKLLVSIRSIEARLDAIEEKLEEA